MAPVLYSVCAQPFVVVAVTLEKGLEFTVEGLVFDNDRIKN